MCLLKNLLGPISYFSKLDKYKFKSWCQPFRMSGPKKKGAN